MSGWCSATVRWPTRPSCRSAKRVTVEKLGKGFFTVRFTYGFFETPDIPEALAAARAHGLALDLDSTTFFLGRETLVPGEHPSLSALAGGALHVAGVERAVAGAVLSPAAGAGGRIGHAGFNLTPDHGRA